MKLEDDRMPLRQARERFEEPRGQRVGIDRQRHGRASAGMRVGAELGERVVLEQRRLAGQPDDRGTRLGRTSRLGSHQDDAAELLLERLDALAHGRRRDVQAAGRRIQGPFVHHGGDGLGEFERDSHQQSG
nr:hypothetical protein GCM10025699_18440 [Microbacterium flavescens]